MKYPMLSEIPASRELIDVFKGYNHNLRIGDGEFYDMTNLSSDSYPSLSPRGKRGTYAVPTHPQGIIAKDEFWYVDGEYLVNGADKYNLGLTIDGNEEGKPKTKTLVSMGAYIIIFPDKKYINTLNPNDYGSLEASYTSLEMAHIFICDENGEEYKSVSASKDPPKDPPSENLDSAVTIILTPASISLVKYDQRTEQWLPVTPYTCIIAPGIGVDFRIGDNVFVSCRDLESENWYDYSDKTLEITHTESDRIILKGLGFANDGFVKIDLKCPDLQYVVEANNRLWGCYSGEKDGKYVNEIYASMLGNFRNWNSFQGISTDSYVAPVGTDGKFTGAIAYLGFPLFFKENFLHKVYGNYPSNYQIQTTPCRGVQDGCAKSLAIVNEVLYYKSRSGVCAYDGSLPVEISYALGDVRYYDAVAGSGDNKYYISMADALGQYNLFAYDTRKAVWHREDDTQAIDFCNFQGDLYFIDHADNQIKTVKGTGAQDVRSVMWEAITGIIGIESPDKKYISRMDVRMSLHPKSRVSIFAEYDSSGEWEHLFTMTGVTLRSFAVPIKPQRCDHMRLKIIGAGDAKIFSICKTIEQGSDI